ncbi:hypothetical protein Acr_00g0091130 [Actinidia rufa]|uniref:Integrase catalytic domain-containing protein n=1 Tax=Actinidia rufa TaxID=165716 RepID=A0A7J0DXB6_9ERIC|nr:hypothetical protein Acr_00g0091130 [Actinidia rufa]
MSGSDVDNVENVVVPPPPHRPDFSLSQHTPGARITCELLNGKNFAAWSRSVRLFLGGKGKSGWLLGTITKPNATDPKFVQWEIDNCTILGWLFNSMEPRIYHVFMYHDMVPLLWSSLTKMYAHARNEALIFELYREIHQASQASLSLSVADYFAYLQSRWEELAQYEPLSEFTTEEGGSQLAVLTIINTILMPSIFEAFAMLDGVMSAAIAFYSYVLHLSQSPPFLIRWLLLLLVPVFSGGRSSSGRAPCSFCGGVTHGRDRCFKLHPELRETFKRNKEKSKASPRTAALSETSYGSPAAPTAPDLHQLQTQFQNQMEQLQLQFQTQLGSLMQQSPRLNPSPSTATLASGIPTALHVRSSNPSWVLDSGADDHMTGELSLFTSDLSSIDQFVRIADGSAVHVRSKGEICLSSQLTLSSVLYVPDFAYNLLSVSRLACDYNCDVIFSSHTCLLQNQNSKKIFGRGYEWNGLYYFGDPPDSLPSISLQASMIKTQFKTTVRTLRSDNGREYVSNDFRSALSQHGLLQQFSCPYTPEQNGVAERKNRSIMTVVRCLLCGMHVPKHFWDMAVLTATYLLNRTPSRILLGKAPLHLLQPIVLFSPFFLVSLDAHVLSRIGALLVQNWMIKLFGTPHSLNPRQGEAPEDPSIFSRPVPLFESPQVPSPTLPPVLTSDPRHMYSRRPPASDPLPQSSPESGNISPISSPVLRRYPTRDRRPPDQLGIRAKASSWSASAAAGGSAVAEIMCWVFQHLVAPCSLLLLGVAAPCCSLQPLIAHLQPLLPRAVCCSPCCPRYGHPHVFVFFLLETSLSKLGLVDIFAPA